LESTPTHLYSWSITGRPEMSVKWWCTSSSSWCGEAVAIMLDITSARYFDGCAWMHAPHEVGFLPRITRYHKT